MIAFCATRIIDEKNLLLEQTNYLIYDAAGNLNKRVRAQKFLIDGEWVFERAEVHEMSGNITKRKRLQLDTASEITDLQEHFVIRIRCQCGHSRYISAAGGGNRHDQPQVRLYTMLTLPFMLMAMVLVAASFRFQQVACYPADVPSVMQSCSLPAVYLRQIRRQTQRVEHFTDPACRSCAAHYCDLLATTLLLEAEDGYASDPWASLEICQELGHIPARENKPMAEISMGSVLPPLRSGLAGRGRNGVAQALDSLTTKDVDGIIRQPLSLTQPTKPPTQAPDCPALRLLPAVPKRFRTNICPGILPSVL